jgi:2-succinyl-5-enolpyruvyl-6-hydroxy-3-cyclohexene-1-carboxylate synthase
LQKDNQDTIKTYQVLRQVVEVCYAHGVEHVVLCPGSRSAPIALSFMRFEGIKHYVIPEERVAAYTALGISRQLKKPVALVCTSGTAALNFAPAVAEAYFSEISLIVFTADRPAEWIGQSDNQAIHQQNLYGKNIKASCILPIDYSHPDSEWFAIRQVNEALNTANVQPKGPVHINIPLREPLYLVNDLPIDAKKPKITRIIQSEKLVPGNEIGKLAEYQKVLVIGGTHRVNQHLHNSLSKLCKDKNLVFIPDITSNLLNCEGAIPFSDLIIDSLSEDQKQEFLPDLIISFGGTVVSKSLKTFLRDNSINAHWHLSGNPGSADVFQKLTSIFDVSAPAFFKAVTEQNILFNAGYYDLWTDKNVVIKASSEKVIKALKFNEVKASYTILNGVPEDTVLHLGNSLPVRFASVFPFLKSSDIEVYSNRGTSGIDGTVSAAAGQSMADSRNHVLICGDLAFMYDSNGLWNNYLKENLKIIVFNNHGGGIFRNLPGPVAQKELEEYFVVKQPLNFEQTALQYNCLYFYCNQQDSLQDKLQEFYASKGKPAVLEIEFTDNLTIAEVKTIIRQQ